MVENLNHKIALGTAQFGLDYGISNQQGQTEESEVKAILDFAASKGISLLDTAQAYGNSEEVLGKWHQNRFQIVTKINPERDNLDVEGLIQTSLTKLRVSSLYAVLFHSAFSAFNAPNVYAQLVDLREQKVINKMGYSVYSPEELMELIDKYGQPDLVQIPYSHLDRRFKSITAELHGLGVEIHSRSTFLQGLLFMNPDTLKPFFNPVKEYLEELEHTFPDKTERACFLLQYVIALPFIDRVVIGVNNSNQLKTNIDCIIKSVGNDTIDHPTLPEEILLPYLWN